MAETQKLTLPVVDLARENNEFGKVIWTGGKTQPVLMAIPAGGEIGGEVHEGHEKLLYFVAGNGVAKIGEAASDIADGDVSIVPSGMTYIARRGSLDGTHVTRLEKVRDKGYGG